MVRYLRITLVMSAIWVALLGTARADSTSVAVLGVEPIDVPEPLAQQLTDALRQRAAGTAGVRAVQGKDLIEIKMVFGCDQEQPACMAQAGRTLGADKLLYGTLKKAGRGGAQVAVNLKLLDVKSGSVERTVGETVGKKELAAGNVHATAAKWFAELVPVEAKPVLTVTSDPPNAAVSVDGNQAGRTPVTLRDLAPGSHTVSLTLAGRISQTRTVDLRPGTASEIAVSLEAEHPAVVERPHPAPEPAVAPPPIVAQPQPQVQPAGHPGRAAKFVALGALVGAVVTGSVAIYTWRTYTGLEDSTHAELGTIRDQTMNPTAEQTQFYGAPTCNPPAGLMGPTMQYQSDCSRGQTYANTTTALWVITGALAGTAVISYIIGDRQAAKAEREKTKSQARLWQKSLRIAPVFSKGSGGVQAAFEF